MADLSGITVVIPYRNGVATLGRLLKSLPRELPVIVVNDMSTERPGLYSGRITWLDRTTRGYFAGAVNTGLHACTTDVLVLNQDVWFAGDAWQQFFAEHRDDGIAGDGVMNHPAWPKGYVQGTCMYLSRAAINKVGDFNEIDFPLWGTTAEWQARACRKGFRAAPGVVPGLMHERGDAPYGKSIQAALSDEPEEAGRFIRTPPLVSVVIPCYNYGHYLQDAVHSLVGGQTSLGDMPGQNFQAFEIVIVDDRSTDDSWQAAQALADSWQGIHAYRMPQNGGTGAAMNYGIERSHGRFIQGLDADDMLEPGALASLYDVVSEDERAVPYHDQQLFTDGKRGEVWTMREYSFDRLLERNLLPAGIMYSRKAWKEAGGYREQMRWGRQDWGFAVALGEVGYCGVHVEEPYYLYRRNGQNRTLRNSDAQWLATFRAQMRELFPALYRGERPVACCGGSRRRPQAQAKPPAQAMRGQMAAMQAAPHDGMVMIEYIGSNLAEQSWWGHATGMHYRFGTKHRVGYVYQSDLEGFMQARAGRQAQFRRYVAPQPKPAPPPVEPPVITQPEPVATPVAAPEAEEKPRLTRRKKSDA